MSRIIAFALLAFVLSACAPQASRVYVSKSQRTMVLLDHENKPMKTYKVALGFTPEGPKREQGDGKTPEGDYLINWRNPNSQYFKSMHINYPNEEDRMHARARGVKPGHSIMIHGLGDKKDAWRRKGDWTQGCIAVSNREMQEIWNMVPDYTPIRIVP